MLQVRQINFLQCVNQCSLNEAFEPTGTFCKKFKGSLIMLFAFQFYILAPIFDPKFQSTICSNDVFPFPKNEVEFSEKKSSLKKN